jgi:hypothetical protein
MMSDSYPLAWVIYLGCSLVVLLALWVNTRNIRLLLLKNSLRATGAVLMLFPYVIGEEESLLAPGIIMFLMEGLFDGSPGRVGLPMFVAWLVAMVIAVSHAIWSRRQQGMEQQMQDLERQRQEMLHESVNAQPENFDSTN